MLQEKVRDYYRGQGYQVLEDAKMLGESGQTHRVEMLVRGSLGYLVVAFPDAGGFEGPEMGAVRRVAKDLQATPVVAATNINPTARAMAMKVGVVLLDVDTLQHEIPVGTDVDEWPESGKREQAPEAHPWPETGRARPEVAGVMRASSVDDLLHDWSGSQLRDEPSRKGRDESLWTKPRSKPQADELASDASVPKRSGNFGWLSGKEVGQEPEVVKHQDGSVEAPLVAPEPDELPGKELIPPMRPPREPRPEPQQYYRRPDGQMGAPMPSTTSRSAAMDQNAPVMEPTRAAAPEMFLSPGQILAIVIFGIVVAFTLFLLLFAGR